jgi:capsule polysaccharide modification protein KpsS
MKKNNKYYFGLVPVFGLNDRNFKFIEFDNGMLNKQEILSKNYYSEKEGIDLKLKYKEKLLSLQTKKFIKKTWIYIIKLIIKDLYRYLLLCNKIKKNNDPNNYWIIRESQGLKKLKNKFYSIFFEYDRLPKEKNYYYFPLHVEPESVLSHWSSGSHEQYSLIEQICRALPVKTNLIIKEHWANPYNADILKLKKLKKIHNVIIIHPKESSIEIIQNSCGVISINGTSLFEAYILNKKALMLGNNYYNSCNFITKTKIENLSEVLKNNDIDTMIDNTFIQLYEETNYSGNINQYFNGVIKNNEHDIDNIVRAISKLILKIKQDK